MNGVSYYQYDGRANIMSLSELIRELDAIVNEFHTRAPTHLNTRAHAMTCPYCHTAHRTSEAKHGRCPYCHRLT